MKNLAKILTFAFTALLSAVISVVITLALIVSDLVVEQTWALAIIMIILSLFVIIAISLIVTLKQQTEKYFTQYSKATVNFTDTSEDAYANAVKLIKSAENSIDIISFYFPIQMSLDAEKARTRFLKTISDRINQKLKDTQQPEFNYRRLLQNDSPDSIDNNVIHEIQLTDKSLFTHCKAIQKTISSAGPSNNVTANFRICEPISSFPSLLIIDKKYALFALLNKRSANDEYSVRGSLEISGNQSNDLQVLIGIFNDYWNSSLPIRVFVDEDDNAEETTVNDTIG